MLVVGIPSKPLSWMAGDLIRSGIRVVPSRVASRAELRQLVQLAATGVLHSEIRNYPLDQVNHVMSALAAGEIFGRAVITP
jgi:D-arabinose 1-dehydrogenase-like Zn-dependent alcohol dehydrogenase